MRLSPDGQWGVLGVGAGTVSVNNQVPPSLVGCPAGAACVISPIEIGYQVQRNGVWTTESYNVKTGTTTTLLNYGSSRVCGGGGIWATFLASSPPQISSNYPYSSSGANLLDVSPGGTLAICPDFQVGQNIQILGGALIPTGPLGSDATAGPNVRVRQGVVSYQDASGWHLCNYLGGAVPFVPRANVNYLMPIVLPNGTVLVLERTDILTVRLATDAVNGWIVDTSNATFSPDAYALSNVAVQVGWSTGQAELPGELVIHAINISTPAVPLDPVQVPRQIPHIAPFLHPCYIAPFFPTPDAPGKACILANSQDWRVDAPAGVQIILTIEALKVSGPPPRDRFLGIYCEQRSFEASKIVAELYGVRLFVGWDDGGREPFPQDLADKLRSFDVPMLELYAIPGESTAATSERVEWHADDLHVRFTDYGFIPQAYTQNGKRGIVDLLTVIGDFFGAGDLTGDCVIVAPFAWGRKDGASASPELETVIRRLAVATPGEPRLEPVSGPKPSDPSYPPVPPTKPPVPNPGPEHPPVQEPVTMDKSWTAIFPIDSLIAPTPVQQQPHQDANKPDLPEYVRGCVALRRADGQIANCYGGKLTFKATDAPGADERFQDAGNCYMGYPGDGSTGYAFPKTGGYGQ